MEGTNDSFADMFYIPKEDLKHGIGAEDNQEVSETPSVVEKPDEIIQEGHGSVEDVTEEPQEITQETGDKVEEESTNGDEKQAEVSAEGVEDASSTDSINYESMIETLIGEKVLDFDDEKEYSMDKEGLSELFSENISKAEARGIENLKKGLPEREQQLLDVLKSGGTLDDFQEQAADINFADIPLYDRDGNAYTNNMRELVKDMHAEQKLLTEDEINERVEDLEKAGLLEKEAALARTKLTEWQETKRQNKIEQLEQDRIAKQEQVRQEQAKFKEEVLNTREIAGFDVSEAKAAKLYDYITKPVKDGKTQFDLDDNAETRMLYAMFAMDGFDKDKLSAKVRTEETRKIKKRMSNYSDTNARRSGGAVRRETSKKPTIYWDMNGNN